MAVLSYTAGISASQTVLASPVSDIFSRISTVMDSSLDSANYKNSSVLSQHIGNNAVLSQHISDGQVVSQKIAALAVRETNMEYRTASGGARVLRLGSAPAGVNGIAVARLSETHTVSSSVFSTSYLWSDAVDGSPGFTTTPVMMGNPMWQVANSTNTAYYRMEVNQINSTGVEVNYFMSATQAQFTATVHIGALGAV